MAGNLKMSDSDGAHPGSGIKVQPSSAETETQKQIWIDDDDERKEHYSKESKPAKLSELLGLNELFSLEVWRASLAELVGTGVLVFALDTIVISTIEAKISAPNLVMSILIAIIVAILLLAANPVSGGHINPVITFAAALLGIISLSRAAVYIFAQCVGAMLGALALKAVISTATANAFALGGCTLHIISPGPDGTTIMGLGAVQGLWLEIFCNFIFLWGSIWMAFDHKQARELGKVLIFTIIGIVVGLLVFVSTVITGEKGYSGVGLNPARCVGAALVRGGHLWNGHWVFWVGPTIACVAFYLYTKLIPRQHYHADGYKHDISNVIKAMFP